MKIRTLLVLMMAFPVLDADQGWAVVDYNKPNYANSPPLMKFVDQLPGLGPANANNLGQYIPIATPDTTTFPGSDYYEIGLRDYTQKMHTSLPPTKLRGYYQKNVPPSSQVSQYLGPMIIAKSGRPCRVKFSNELGVGAAGNLFLPVDTTVMGAGMGPLGMAAGNYPQNRATLHLHGGDTPWISDGTPNQWITPAGETNPYAKGIDVVNVPDMPKPAAGSMNFYWPNGQSGRLMFYHDHSYGLTRLNVYAGEAAGYLLTNPAEEDALKLAGVPGTFPSTGAPDLAHLIPLIIQDKSFVSDSTVPTAANSNFWTSVTDPLWDSIQWGAGGSLWFPHVYMPNQTTLAGGMNPLGRWDYGPLMFPPAVVAEPNLPDLSVVPEAFMDTPVINGTAFPFVNVGPTAYRFRILNASNDRFYNLQLYVADATGTGKEVTMVPADGALYPNLNPQPGELANLAVPFDGRPGGVPDPRTVGPPMIQIGNEGGLLPAVAVLPNTPIDYDWDRKSMTYGSVRNFPLIPINPAEPIVYPRVGYTLLLGPAERADVIIDFSQFRGKTLILYNDAPAPFPFFDPRYDLYTGSPDQSLAGGPPATVAGWGPNTRTLMQIRVGTGTPAPFNPIPIQDTLPGIFALSQPGPIVAPGVFGSNLLWKSTGTFAGLPIRSKSIAEDFDPIYGRMIARLGNDYWRLNAQGLDSFGVDFIEPPADFISEVATKPDGTQIWFVGHMGVDTHTIHFHLFNVQVVNRVDWAGVIKPPDPNELGWKETVRMNSFEGVILAVRPKKPTVPFKVPTSVRPLDVTRPATGPLGSTYDATTNPNPLFNFDWQYVWHCHILGHEENDMMRPLILVTKPFPPTQAVAAQPAGATAVTVSWKDTAKNETGFHLQRATNAVFTAGVTTFQVGASNGTKAKPKSYIGSTVSFTDNTFTPGATYYYRVRSYNTANNSGWIKTAPITTH